MNIAVGRFSVPTYAPDPISSTRQDASGVNGFEKKPGAVASLKMALAGFRQSLSSVRHSMLSSADFSEAIIHPRAQMARRASAGSVAALPLRGGLKDGKLDAEKLISYLGKDAQSPYNQLEGHELVTIDMVMRGLIEYGDSHAATAKQLTAIETTLDRIINSPPQSQPGTRKARAEKNYRDALKALSAKCELVRTYRESAMIQAPTPMRTASVTQTNDGSSAAKSIVQSPASGIDAVEHELDDILGELQQYDPAFSATPEHSTMTEDDIAAELTGRDVPTPGQSPVSFSGSPAIQQDSTGTADELDGLLDALASEVAASPAKAALGQAISQAAPQAAPQARPSDNQPASRFGPDQGLSSSPQMRPFLSARDLMAGASPWLPPPPPPLRNALSPPPLRDLPAPPPPRDAPPPPPQRNVLSSPPLRDLPAPPPPRDAPPPPPQRNVLSPPPPQDAPPPPPPVRNGR